MPELDLDTKEPEVDLPKVPERKESNKELPDLSSILPSFSIDSSQIKADTDKAWAQLQDWYAGLLAQAGKNETENLKNSDNSESKNDNIAETNTDKIIPEPVESPAGTWKSEEGKWTLYDRAGKAVEAYDGKVKDVSRDSEGNSIVKLNDGTVVKEKQDGSTLKYDSNNNLNKITYKDGSTRSFSYANNELTGMSSKSGEWTRKTDASGKYTDEWVPKGQTKGWKGDVSVDEKTGAFRVDKTTYHSDLSVEKNTGSGSEITYPNKEVVKVNADGQVSEINYPDGSKRKFSWKENPDAKGDNDKFSLSAVEVHRDGKYYRHTKQDDGSWRVSSWSNGSWTAPEKENLSFSFDNKNKEYSYINSEDGVLHELKPGGFEKHTTKEGAVLEYKDSKLVAARINDRAREFEWKGDKLVAIHDGIQGKNWTKDSDGNWVSDRGDKRQGEAFVSAPADISFKNGDKTSIVKLDGTEYERITNEKEKSQVDKSDGKVQVKAGDGSQREFKTSADGLELTHESVTRNGKTDSWTRGERLANGNYIWSNDQNPDRKEERSKVTQKDGVLSIEYPDGRKYQANTDGTEKLENSKEDWYINYKDGRPSETKYADGTLRKFTFDGDSDSPSSIEVTSAKDGSVTKIDKRPDGSYNYKTEDAKEPVKWNAEISVKRDGTYAIVDRDEKGKTTTRSIDGHKIVDNPSDKSRVESFKDQIDKVVRDGKSVELVRDENRNVTELRDSASNTKYVKNSNGEFEAKALDPSKPFAKLDELQRKGEPVLEESGTVNFCQNDGRQLRQEPGQKAELVSSKEQAIEAATNNSSMTAQEKERLSKNILDYAKREDVSPEHKSVFQESLAKFAERKDISDQEKAKTYEQLNRLLESKTDKNFSSSERALLASQMLWQVAFPDKNAQGQNPNCQVTTVRGMLLYNKPSEFARMLTDVITTGQFKTMDGSVIKPPASSFRIPKDSEESKFPPQDGTRTWIGKICDVTVANVHWQRQTKAPNGTSVNKGELVYRQDPPESRKDSGARLYRDRGDGYIYPQNDSSGKLIKQPTLYAKDIASAYRQIVGENTENVVLAVNRTDIKGGPGVCLATEAQLHNVLSKGGTHVAQIWTGADWCWKEPARHHNFKPRDENNGDGEHVVLVKDYDPVTKTVAVDNSWSQKYDRIDKDRRISLSELYKAMAKQD